MDIFASFPREISVNSRPGAKTYKLMPGYYAVHALQPGTPPPDAAYLFNEGTIGVFKGSPNQAGVAATRDNLSPVYALLAGGSPAVPTGLIFLRLAEGAPVAEYKEAIKGAGYVVAESLAYAPNAAWLRARSDNIADALTGVKALEELPDVESVEPQMLMENARR